jgi:hypothetical protein
LDQGLEDQVEEEPAEWGRASEDQVMRNLGLVAPAAGDKGLVDRLARDSAVVQLRMGAGMELAVAPARLLFRE